MENIIIDIGSTVLTATDIAAVGAVSNEGMYTEEGMLVDTGMTTVKDPLLSSWVFVIGISTAVLFVSVAVGLLLAKRRIKKGIEIYED